MKNKMIVLENFYNITITHVHSLITPEFWSSIPHSHDHCEIFIHLTGELDIFVEKNSYHVQDKCIRVYRSNELHYGKTDFSQMMEWYQISIPQSFFINPENIPVSKILYNREAGQGNVFGSSEFHILTDLLSEAFYSYESNSDLCQHYFRSAVIKILCILNEPKYNLYITTQKNRILYEIINIIYSDFQNISTVYDLSNITHYSTSYLHKAFKEAMNITPYQFILDKKLSETKKALRNGCTIIEACDYAGFNNYTNFITLFKKKYGITPKKYQLLQENSDL